jgi:arylsulfatase A-like enzyme
MLKKSMQRILTQMVAAALSLVAFTSRAEHETRPSRPNIVFILSDDHRWDGLRAAGNKAIVTPHLDKLCKDSVLFTHGVVAAPQCCPSRAVLLTGLYPHQNGCYSNKLWSKDAERGFGEPTVVELLRDAGYQTTLIGKWHLKPLPWKCGFNEIRRWMPQGADSYEDAKLARGRSDEVKESRGHVTEIFSDDAVAYLNERAKAKGDAQPFFLWLAYTAPHTPQRPVPQSCRAPYANLPRDHCPPGFPPQAESNDFKSGPWAQYYSAITHLDQQVGRVLQAIDDNGLRENTVVVFLGDNGWMMGSHGRFGKMLPEDESSRVPFIVRAPAPLQGWAGASGAMASSIDLPVTWLALAGAPVPETFAGSSLLPLLADPKPKEVFRDTAFFQFEDEKNWPGLAYRAARTADWKYVLRPTRPAKELKSLKKKLLEREEEKENRKMPNLETEQLFDLRNDPHELHDVAAAPQAAAALRDMRERLRQELERTADPALKWLKTHYSN